MVVNNYLEVLRMKKSEYQSQTEQNTRSGMEYMGAKLGYGLAIFTKYITPLAASFYVGFMMERMLEWILQSNMDC